MQAAFLIQSDSFRWIHLDQAGHFIQTGSVDFRNSKLLLQNLEDCISKHPELSLPFSSLKIIWVSPYFQLMPSGHVFRDFAFESAIHLLPDFSNLQMQDDEVADLDLLNIYKIDQYTAHFLMSKYPEASFTHLLSLLLPLYSEHLQSVKSPRLYLHIEQRNLHAFAFNNGKLKLAASYPISSSRDLLYFSLLSLKKLNTSQYDTNVCLTGMIEEGSLYWNTLAPYFPDMSILKMPFGKIADLIPQEHYLHYHFDLYAGLI